MTTITTDNYTSSLIKKELKQIFEPYGLDIEIKYDKESEWFHVDFTFPPDEHLNLLELYKFIEKNNIRFSAPYRIFFNKREVRYISLNSMFHLLKPNE